MLNNNEIGLYFMIIFVSITYISVYQGMLAHLNSKLYVVSAVIVLLSPVVSGWILIFNQKCQTENTLKMIESFIMICSSLSIGLALFSRTINGECEVVSFMDSWHCNPHFSSHSLPQDTGESLNTYVIEYSY